MTTNEEITDMGAYDLVKADTMRLPTVVEPPAGLDPEAILATPPDARDITAELAAPPRRKLPWLTLCLSGGLVAALAFTGGVWYQKNNGTASRSAFAGAATAARQGTGRAAGGYGGFGRTGSGQAGAGQTGTDQTGTDATVTAGTVKVVDGNTVYLTDSQGNTVKITTGGSTKVRLSKDGKVSDLQPGQTVVVQGTQDSSGGVAATQVTEGSTGAGGFGGFGGFAGFGAGRTASGGNG